MFCILSISQNQTLIVRGCTPFHQMTASIIELPTTKAILLQCFCPGDCSFRYFFQNELTQQSLSYSATVSISTTPCLHVFLHFIFWSFTPVTTCSLASWLSFFLSILRFLCHCHGNPSILFPTDCLVWP